MGEPLRVSVVAQDPLLEAGATSALRMCPDVTVVLPREAAKVTVVIVDRIGNHELDIVRGLREQAHQPEVVLVAADLAPAEALHAVLAGARGLLRRCEAGPARLERAVLAAASGDCTLPPDMFPGLLDHATSRPAARTPGPSVLSERERAVLALIADGRETSEIARELHYSPRTVVGVVRDITHRFRLSNRAHAVAYALRTGLL